eukprot:scaffold2188_cov253-Pinguiococcus_pyrenoidosus.AAC.2
MGWHDANDGTLFLGLNIEQGRVRDIPDGPQWKTGLRALVDKFNFDLTMTPSQSIIIRGIKPEQKEEVEAFLASHQIPLIEQIDPLVRLGKFCGAKQKCRDARSARRACMF